jgi:hypothetical protein
MVVAASQLGQMDGGILVTSNQPRSALHRDLPRLALRLDAAASGGLGVLLLAAGPALDGPLGAPLELLWPAGLFLVAFAAALWAASSRPTVSRAALWTVIAINLLWVVDSVALVALGWFPLSGLGVGFVLTQAAAVALLAELQFLALRRTAA